MDKIEEIIGLIDSHEKNQTRDLFVKYLKHWPWFIAFCGLGIVLGYLNYKYSPRIYSVNSHVLVVGEDKSLGNLLAFNNPVMGMGKKNNIENQIGILKSYTLFSEAINKLNWKTSWYKKELLYKKELYKNVPLDLDFPPNAINATDVFIEITILNDKEFQLKADGETYQNGSRQVVDLKKVLKFGEPFTNDFFNFTINKGDAVIDEVYYLNFNSKHNLTTQYLSKTDIFQEEINSDIIVIEIEGENVQKEADFINELNNVFTEFGVNNKSKDSENSLKFIDSQLERIKGNLSVAENNFSSYRKNNQVMNLGQEAQLVYSKLEEIENEKYLIELQINFYKELQQYLDDSKKISQMVNPSVIGITDPNLNNMLSRLMELYSRREVLSYSVQDKNPSVIVIEKEIKITRDGLDETLKNQLKATESKMESITERYNTIESRLQKLPETEKQLIGIQREFDLSNEMYTYMMQKKAEASITKASIAPEVQIIDPARPEGAIRVGPNLIINAGGGLFLGFMLPFIFILGFSFFNTKIETREEIEKISKISVLEGIIAHKYKEELPVIYHPRSGIAESFRGLKSNLKALLEQPGSTVVSINSLIPGEGKSFISSNFSAILAKSNRKVLLIGSDLHKPTLHRYLNVQESIGLSNYFQDEKTFEEIIFTTFIPNLHFIQAGPTPNNPSELLDNSKFELLVEEARKLFDFIIIDNAPVLLVPDAILTSNFSDVSLFVVRINYSHKDEIKQINKVVEFNKVKNAAIVINEAPDRGYGYGNKYWKKGYGEYKPG